ncbi:MAG TPA: rhomboid family intramembrane serine protease [Streptosporangiaceae bacterium]|jgi:putative flippase GtrA|nr:rhomboid family intramembrane serine protease [Streptosporangiaceae bacterium]
MSSLPDKIVHAALRLVPAPIERKLRTEAGKRFSRFALVAVVAVITSQVVLGLLTGPVNLTAGASGVIASMTAALVSYLLSRWAWERTGRPDLLRETVPFWLVSAAVWGILGLTSHYASVFAHAEGYTHFKKHLVVQGAYFLMNCITFVARFVFFHYVLFANKESPASTSAPSAPAAPPAEPDPASSLDRPELANAEATRGGDTGPMALVSGDSGPPRP